MPKKNNSTSGPARPKNKPSSQDTSFLEVFGLAPKSKQVLLDIITHGTSPVADISTRLNIPKSTVYDALIPLLSKSLVNEYSDTRGRLFGVSEVSQLSRVHEKDIKDLQAAHTSLLNFIQAQDLEDSVARPRIKFYAGKLGIQQAFRDMPWDKNITEAYLMWPMKDMLKNAGEEFLQWHSEQRLRHKVMLNTIQKDSDRPLKTSKPMWFLNPAQLALHRTRYLPKNFNWQMSFWIYGNKCLFASGGKEMVAFTVHSKEFCEMMLIMWQATWEKARV